MHASSAAGSQSDAATEFPQSQEESIAQAVEALELSLRVDPKRKKKGFGLWTGVKRLAVEVPIRDGSAESQLALAVALLAALPAAAGLPVVVFGEQAATDLARDRNVPFEVYSVEECRSGEPLTGPLLCVCTSREQGALLERIVDELWRGKALIVVNAGWLQDTPYELEDFAAALDPVYFFLPVEFQGVFGGKSGFVFRWARSAIDSKAWQIFLDEGAGPRCVGRMGRKPSQSDLETAVYNASAAKSPLTAGAKMFRGLADKLRGAK